MKNDTRFSKFAKMLHSFIGGKKYYFIIELLKGGLDENGVDYIKSLRSDESGKGRILNYLSGRRDITEIAPEIVNSYDNEFFKEYLEEVIDENKYCDICKILSDEPYHIIVDEYNLLDTLADIYKDILEGAAKGENSKCSIAKKNQRRKTSKLSDINAADKKEMQKITGKIIHSFDKMKHILEEKCDYIAESKKNKSNEDEIKEGLKEYKIQLADQFEFFNMLNLELISFREIYPDRGTGPLFELATVFCEFELDALTCTLSKPNEYHFSDIMNNYESALVVFRDFIFKY